MTDFERAVYDALLNIPQGRVATYAVIARAVGKPGAARAVGNALNKNPHAPRVPCHRVVCADGSLGGYAFGQKRKKILLEKEGVTIIQNTVDLNIFGIQNIRIDRD